jgi:hypothetical protein
MWFRVKGKVFLVPAMKAYSWSRGIASLILNISTRWECMGNFKSWLLYPRKEGWVGS